MEKIAFYRKYRPQDFSEVKGQKPIVKTLIGEIKNDHIAHSYIFAGNKGSGKTTLAKIFSKAINCLNPIDGYNPCNECDNCKAINNNLTTDFTELDAASNSGVNDIRTITDNINYHPMQLKYKVIILDEAHMLSNSSWNALLKSVEEPPSFVIFIFATTEYHKIPSTIVSRCQRFDFNKIDSNDIISQLEMVAKKEKIKIEKEVLSSIAKMSDGALRDALSILNQLTNYGDSISNQTLIDVFGIIDIKSKINFLNLIWSQKTNELISLVKQYNSSGINIMNICEDILNILMDKLIYLRTNDASLMSTLTSANVNDVEINNQEIILKLINIFIETIDNIKKLSNNEFIFELAVMNSINTLNNSSNTKNINTHNYNYNQTTSSQKPNIEATKKEITIDLNADSDEKQMFRTKELDINELIKNKERNGSRNINTEIVVNESKPTENIWKNRAQKSTSTIKHEIKTSLENNNTIQEEPVKTETAKSIKKSFSYDEDFSETFFSIAVHNNAEQKKTLNDKFNKLKEFNIANSFPINLFFEAKNFFVCSENGAVLLYDTKAKAFKFNENNTNKALLDFFRKEFGSEKVLIAVDNKQALIYKDEFKKIDKNKYNDVKINNEKKTLLLDILNED